MDTVNVKISNGNTLHYHVINGISVMYGITLADGTYSESHGEKLSVIIAGIVRDGHRYRFWYGENGKVWNETYDVAGYVGLSGGKVKVPLLLKNKASIGGGALSSHIVRIDRTDTRKTIYQSPDFRMPVSSIVENEAGDKFEVYMNRELVAVFPSYAKAERLVEFMTGKRYAP